MVSVPVYFPLFILFYVVCSVTWLLPGEGAGGCELLDANFCWESLVASRCIYASILVNETDSG